MSDTSKLSKEIKLLLFSIATISLAIGSWVGFRSALILGGVLIKILSENRNLTYPQPQIYFGIFSFSFCVVVSLGLGKLYIDSITAVAKQETSFVLSKFLVLTLAIGVFIGVGYLGLFVLLVNLT